MSAQSTAIDQILITAISNGQSDGFEMQELLATLALQSITLTVRQLRRRLKKLVDRGVIRAVGQTRNRRYAPYATTLGDEEAPTATAVGAASLSLSAEAREVEEMVRMPLTSRRPVTYREAFLDEYIPGRTSYLPEETRNRLRVIGRTDDATRPAGTFARDIYERLLIDLAWSSSRLEGNTYNRLDTLNLLEHGVKAEGKDAREAVMILNHKKAIAMLVDQAEWIGFNGHTIRNLHSALSEGLMTDPADEGRLREKIVEIGGSTYVPISIPQKIDEHFRVILAKANDIPDPFEQSFFMMVHLPYLQPFVDVNKRTSRLAANISLVKANLCPLSFIDVPEQSYVDGTLAIYELNRVELLRDVYVWAYERSCAQYHVVQASIAQPDPIRLRYRQQINDAVREMVINGEAPIRSAIARRALQCEIPAADNDAFVELALELLLNLHDGSTYRYGIRMEQYENWKRGLKHSEA